MEFNGQLMRLPNPFFGPGMFCRGKVVGFDEGAENYTINYLDGPFEQDEVPSGTKLNFPRGTVFEYCKRANIVVNLGGSYRPHFPAAVILITQVQFLGMVWFGMGDEEGRAGLEAMSVGPFYSPSTIFKDRTEEGQPDVGSGVNADDDFAVSC